MRAPASALLLPLLLVAAVPLAAAQGEGNGTAPEAVTEVRLSPAVEKGDWRVGAWLAIAGGFGAAAALFPTLGVSVPGLKEDPSLKLDEENLRSLEEGLRKSVGKDAPDHHDVREINAAVREARRTLGRRKTLRVAASSVAFVLLGGGTAALFAHDLLQAVAFGAGWGAVLGVVIAKHGVQEKVKAKEEGMDLLLQHQAKLEAEATASQARTGTLAKFLDVPADAGTASVAMDPEVKRRVELLRRL